MKRRILSVWLVIISLFSLSVAVAPTADAAGSKLTSTNYVALGDSYSAGDFIGADHAYPALLAGGLVNVDFKASSGYGTAELLAHLPSTPQKSVKYVTLTVGANDTSWTTSLTKCAADPNNCPAELLKLNKQIDALKPRLPKVIAGVHKAYPNAKIYWAGYVRPFVPKSLKQTCAVYNPLTNTSTPVPGVLGVAVDATLLRLNANVLGAVGSARLKGVPVKYVAVDALFSGHRYCDDDPWLVLVHPDTRGHKAYQKGFLAAGIPGHAVTSSD